MVATDYDFSQTRTQILERAMRQVGALALGEVMSAEQEQQGATILNTIVKSWQSRRTFLWTLSSFTQAFTISVATYTLPTNPPFVSVDAGFIRDSDNYDTIIERYSLADFKRIPDKTETGEPRCFSSDGTNLLLWPVPDATTYSFYGVGVTRLKDWDTAGATGDFPSQWINPLVYAVASDLATEYGLPIGERQQLKIEAESYFKMVRSGCDGTGECCFIKGAF